MTEDGFVALVLVVFVVLTMMTFWKQILFLMVSGVLVTFFLGLVFIASNLQI